jgi:hypothetical protein
MNITRHNYEEFFILYLDNELSSNDRRLVKGFVQQHPDLKEELDLLFQYKLVPDTHIVFDGKEDLIKINGDTPVTLSNYDEWLVLYMDNELSPAQQANVEEFIAANPAVNEEFILLQRTRLQPEEIVFADKASLYRKEEKVRPMPVRWWRIAAAAILLLGIGIATAVFVNNKPAGEIVKGTTSEKNTPLPVTVPKESNDPVNENIVAENNNTDLTPAIEQVVTIPIKEKSNTVKDRLPVIILPPAKEEIVVVNNNDKKSNDLPKPLYNPNMIKNDAGNNTVVNNNLSNETIKPKNTLTNPVVTTQNPSSSEIVYATNHNSDVSELEQPDGKKNKNRGIFRKIARTFEKRTDIDPTDDNRLLVAGLSINLK